jgi:lipopolysaccharide transport system permease protein
MTPASVEATRERPVTVIRARRRAGTGIGELWRYRDLLVVLAGRDLKLRYRQTAVGVLWVIILPLLAAGIFTVVFGRVAGLTSEGVPYLPYALVGMATWQLFAGAVSRSSVSVVGSASMVSKVYFPRIVLPVSTLGAVMVDFVIALGLVAAVLAGYDVGVRPAVAMVPVWAALMLLIAGAIGLVAAAVSVRYRDVQHVTPVLIQLLFFASPVAYGLAAVPESVQLFFAVNPLSPILQGMRWSLLGTDAPELWTVVYATVVACSGAALAAVIFRRAERNFADVI